MVAAGVTPHVIAEQLGHRDARLVCNVTGTSIRVLAGIECGQTWGGGGFSEEPSERKPCK
jgi:hypothetical protein